MTAGPGTRSDARLLLMGNIPVDLTQRVDLLPRVGEDLRTEHPQRVSAGGGFHVVHAAWRSGLRARFAGVHGSGPFGDLVRRALASVECEVVRPADTERDTAVVVVLVTPSGERTFVSPSASVPPFAADVLGSLCPGEDDIVYVSGYSLGLGPASAPLAGWVAGLPSPVPVFCDLGPWGAEAAAGALEPVLARVDWLACNAHEAEIATGEGDPATAVRVLQRRTQSAGVLVRVGADGCWLARPGAAPTLVPVREPALDPIADASSDSTGAGDAHSGAFLAALAAGRSPRAAVEHANVVAHRVVNDLTVPSGRQGFGSELAGED